MSRWRVARTGSVLCGAALAACGWSAAPARTLHFDTPHQAITVLAEAVRSGSLADLQAVLGTDARAVLASGDPRVDRADRARFLARLERRHALVDLGPGRLQLDVGDDAWPLPFPLVRSNGGWHWDGAAGAEETRLRRIGQHEIAAIEVCRGVVSAQEEYAAADRGPGVAPGYAQRLVSTPGQRDGLYWEGTAEPSPIGPLLAGAAAERYDPGARFTPYHGYYYRMLSNGAGFGFLAFPADYGTSGIMTFLCSQTGVVYQKDLGDDTATLVAGLSAYVIDGTWQPVE